MFVRYANLGGNSGVEMFEEHPDQIAVTFAGSEKVYIYSYRSAGKPHVEAMKELARHGQGLNTYINKNCRYLYEK